MVAWDGENLLMKLSGCANFIAVISRKQSSRFALAFVLLVVLCGCLASTSFASETAGVTIPGTTDYPAGGMFIPGVVELPSASRESIKAFADEPRGVVNVIAGSADRFRVYRLGLSDLSEQAYEEFEFKGARIDTAVYDPVGNDILLVVGLDVLRVGLDDFSTDVVATAPREASLVTSFLEPAERVATFIGSPGGGSVRLDLDTLESEAFSSNTLYFFVGHGHPDAVDEANRFAWVPAYFLILFRSGIMKLDLETGTQSAWRESLLSGDVSVDPSRGRGYAMQGRRVQSFSLATLETLEVLDLDITSPTAVDAYADRSTGELILSMYDGGLTRIAMDPMRVGERYTPDIPIQAGEILVRHSDNHVLAYSATENLRLRLYETAPSFRLVAEREFARPSTGVAVHLRDDYSGLLLTLTNGHPAELFRYASPRNPSPQSLRHVFLPYSNGPLLSGVTDSARRRAYFATDTQPSQIVALDLNSLEVVDSIELEDGEDAPLAATIDVEGGVAYFATHTSPGRIVRVGLNPLARLDAVTLGAGDDFPRALFHDPIGHQLIAGLFTTPARVIALDDTTLATIAESTLVQGEQEITGGAIDPVRRRVVFGTGTAPARAVEYDLDSHTRTSALTFDSESRFATSTSLDVESGDAFVMFSNAPSRVAKLSFNPLRLRGMIESSIESPNALLFVPNQGLVAAGTVSGDTRRSTLARQIATSFDSAVSSIKVFLPNGGRADSMNFFSHASAGNLWFAIQRDNAPGSWPSVETVWSTGPISNTGGELTVQVLSQGTALYLAPGEYWLTWATDSSMDVPGFAGEFGFESRRAYTGVDTFGDPISLPQEYIETTEAFSIHLDFSRSSEAGGWDVYE